MRASTVIDRRTEICFALVQLDNALRYVEGYTGANYNALAVELLTAAKRQLKLDYAVESGRELAEAGNTLP